MMPFEGRAQPVGEASPLHPVQALLESARVLFEVDASRALELVNQANILAHEQGDPIWTAQADLARGLLEVEVGEASLALPYLLAAHDTFKRLDFFHERLETLEGISRACLYADRYDEAQDWLSVALIEADRVQRNDVEARLYNILAGVQHARGDYETALLSMKKSLVTYSKLTNRSQEVKSLCNIGNLLMSMGRYDEALEYLKNAYSILTSFVDDSRTLSIVMLNLGLLSLEVGRPLEAEDYLSNSLDLAREKGNKLVESAAILNLANSRKLLGKIDLAKQNFEDALHLSELMGDKQGQAYALDSLGTMMKELGDVAQARVNLKKCLLISEDTMDLKGQIDASLHLGQLEAQEDNASEALEHLTRALELAQKAGRPKSELEAHCALYEVHKAAGHLSEALAHLEQAYHLDKQLFNEASDRKVRELSAQFELERARHEADVQRLRSETADIARQHAEEEVRKRTFDLEQAQLEVVTRLAVAAEYRDDSTGQHTLRVGQYAAALAQALGLPPEEVELLRVAARLHDVGKIGIPDDILLKSGKLGSEEYVRMQAHTLIGARILSGGQSRLLRLAEEIAESHHEHWDGRGYPLGRSKEQIPLSARIVAVADVFDALTQERPYKKAWPLEEALSEIERGAATHFDPQIAGVARSALGPLVGS